MIDSGGAPPKRARTAGTRSVRATSLGGILPFGSRPAYSRESAQTSSRVLSGSGSTRCSVSPAVSGAVAAAAIASKN
jgi:hypothetical protein